VIALLHKLYSMPEWWDEKCESVPVNGHLVIRRHDKEPHYFDDAYAEWLPLSGLENGLPLV